VHQNQPEVEAPGGVCKVLIRRFVPRTNCARLDELPPSLSLLFFTPREGEDFFLEGAGDSFFCRPAWPKSTSRCLWND